jgi:glutamate-ammonia-ligase adenylyltransferase
LIKATALSHKHDRDERARQEFLFSFTTELAKHRGADADLGLSLLLDFVRATRGKATFFTMLLRSPRLIEDLARLFRQSPYLGSILASRPELLDHFILQVDEAWSTDTAALLGQMAERKLLTEIWSANQYLADGDLPVMFERVSSTADEICLALLAQLKREFPAARLEILALGKWGGRELGLRSDLDFIFVTPLAPGEDDFKAARRFISRLTDPLKGGHLYDIDLRLRPSGRSGPLLVSEEQLFAYWRGEAQAWERQAYLRARRLAAGAPLPLEAFVERGLSGEDLSELKRIRAKLLQAASVDTGAIDLKHVPGGLIDIEFTVQTAVLAAGAQPAGARRTGSASAEPAPAISGPATSTLGMIDALSAADPAWASAAGRIKEIYLDIRRLEQMLQLASARKISAVERDSAAFIKAAALTGTDAATAWARLLAVTREARDHLNALDPTGFKI